MSKMRDADMPLLDRIEAAIKRITHGEGPMRVPAEATDPDLVLRDCQREIDRLTREHDEARAERDAMRILVESTCHALHRAGVTSANAPDDPGEAIDIIVAERDALAKALDTIHSWLVCAAIASAEDMAQSFAEMEQIAAAALAAKEK